MNLIELYVINSVILLAFFFIVVLKGKVKYYITVDLTKCTFVGLIMISLLSSLLIFITKMVIPFLINFMFLPLAFFYNIKNNNIDYDEALLDAIIMSHMLGFLYSLIFGMWVTYYATLDVSKIVLMIIYITLPLFLFILTFSYNNKTNTLNNPSIYKFDLSIILLIVFLFMGINLSLYIANRPKLIGDMYVHDFLTKSLLFHNETTTNYVPAFSLYLSILKYLSNSSDVFEYSYILLLPYEVFIILTSYYLMAKSFILNIFNRKDLIMFTTAIATLLYPSYGLGMILFFGLFFLKIDQLKIDDIKYNIFQIAHFVSSKTYDVYDYRVLTLPDIVAPFWFVGVPLTYYSLYIINKSLAQNNIENKLYSFKLLLSSFIISLVTAYVLVLIILYIYIYLMIKILNVRKTYNNINIVPFQKYLLITLLSIFSVLVFYYFFQNYYHYYFLFEPLTVFGGSIFHLYLEIIIFLLITLILFSLYDYIYYYLVFFISLIQNNKIFNYFIKYSKVIISIRTYLFIVFSYIFLSFFFYVIYFNSLNANYIIPCLELDPISLGCRSVSIGYYLIPWYVIPLRYGFLFLIFLVLLVFFDGRNISNSVIFYATILYILFFIILESLSQLLFYLGIYVPVYRFSFITHSFIVILTSFLIINIFYYKKFFARFILLFLLVYSLLSLMAYYFILLVAFY